MFNIIPQPVSILINQDKKGFTLHTGTLISPYDFVQEFISVTRKCFNKKVSVHEDTGEERSIILTLNDSVEHNEGYTIKCENRRVFINAKSEAGLFYGLQTLKQMLIQTDGKLPYTEITDYPQLSHRGLALESRGYSLDDVKRIVDMMCVHKLNVLRWCDKNDYTTEEQDEIVAYCSSRFIRVVSANDNTDRIYNKKHPYCIDYPYGVNTLKNVCDAHDNASAESLSGAEAILRMNMQADMRKVEYYAFPRLGAFSENCWSESEFSSFSAFVHRAHDYYRLLDAYDVHYAPLKKACPHFADKQLSRIYFRIFGKKRQ